jgi:two-component system response regulator AtoC
MEKDAETAEEKVGTSEAEMGTPEVVTGVVLVVDDEKSLRWSLAEGLREDGYDVVEAENGTECFAVLDSQPVDVVLLDLKLPGEDGLTILQRIKHSYPEVTVVMMTAYGKFEDAVKATKIGCYNYIGKPFELDHMRLVIRNALATASLRKEVEYLRDEERRKYRSDYVFGSSQAIRKVLASIKKVSERGFSTVLIMGETGTGKELMARQIHLGSPWKEAPFVEVNCSAVPGTLLESELFGHEKGAFTDAHAAKKGLFELANRGTLFLDEIGEMSLELQSKLLRVMETKRFKRVGGVNDIQVETRIIAATNRNLRQAVDKGSFREDLYYRLTVIPIQLPPLRERREDVPVLIKCFVDQFNSELRKTVSGASKEAVEVMMAYNWPGNVRELRNVIERAMLLESEEEILPEHLPREIFEEATPSGAGQVESFISDSGRVLTLDEVEELAIGHALRVHGGNKTRAAQALGISRQTLRTKLKQYGMAGGDAPEA